jgi:hypothetical protein
MVNDGLMPQKQFANQKALVGVRRAERPCLRVARFIFLRQAATPAIAGAIRDCRGAHVSGRQSGDAVLEGHYTGRAGDQANQSAFARLFKCEAPVRYAVLDAPPSTGA